MGNKFRWEEDSMGKLKVPQKRFIAPKLSAPWKIFLSADDQCRRILFALWRLLKGARRRPIWNWVF